ncbi:MAG: 50S ribosomal protein L29 [Bacteroidota bacterium]|jgi:large subunit ribosomal protein L29|nr:50S ribosomal protein L29 [Bacteroidota bacterium]MCA6443030.1 50S ribosomal protein L29 [Bacteroidota bacterium]
MKNKEIISLSDAELNEKVSEGKLALNKIKLNQAISPVENPAKIRTDRRAIARMLTEVSKRKNAAKK